MFPVSQAEMLPDKLPCYQQGPKCPCHEKKRSQCPHGLLVLSVFPRKSVFRLPPFCQAHADAALRRSASSMRARLLLFQAVLFVPCSLANALCESITRE